MLRVRALGLGRRQRDAAAAHDRLADGVYHVAADGTDVKLAPGHMGGAVAVAHVLAREQLQHRNAQRSGQRLQQTDVRKALPRFPFAYGLAGDVDPVSQRLLCHFSLFPEPPDHGSRYVSVHLIAAFRPHDSMRPREKHPALRGIGRRIRAM